MKPSATFWKDRRVFLTGHTGFKGAWLLLLLHRLGAQVTGFSLPGPVSSPSLFDAGELGALCDDHRGDIRDSSILEAALTASRAEVLIHMAAQPIVRAGMREPLETLSTNVMGTANVLNTSRHASGLRTIVIVTSDKCYENRERVWPYREDDAMGGSDPYSASKGAAELITVSFAKTYFNDPTGPSIVSVRAGNVIGGGDWAADRLLPDLVRASHAGGIVDIRSPNAVRPWQHVLDPLAGYLLAAEHAFDGISRRPHDAWNFGPNPGEEMTVHEVVDTFRRVYATPVDVRLADMGENAAAAHKEASILRVDATKAKVELGWRPALSNAAAVESAAMWYSRFPTVGDAAAVRRLTEDQIHSVLGV